MTQDVTDEQFGKLGGRIWDLQRRVRQGGVPFDLAMDGLQAVIEHDQERLVSLVGPVYPKGTIALPLEIDLSLPLSEMIRRGKYANEDQALKEITEDRFPINRKVPDLQYSTTVLLIPRYREPINFRDQEGAMEANHLGQQGVVEVCAIGEQYPHLQLAYWIIGSGSAWEHPVGVLCSPVLYQGGGGRKLYLSWRDPVHHLDENARCVALPQAVT